MRSPTTCLQHQDALLTAKSAKITEAQEVGIDFLRFVLAPVFLCLSVCAYLSALAFLCLCIRCIKGVEKSCFQWRTFNSCCHGYNKSNSFSIKLDNNFRAVSSLYLSCCTDGLMISSHKLSTRVYADRKKSNKQNPHGRTLLKRKARLANLAAR